MAKSNIGGLGPTILATAWSLIVVALGLIACRYFSASKKDNRWRWDFLWASASVFLIVIAAGFLTRSVLYGSGNHVTDLELEDIFMAGKWALPAIIIGTVSVCFSKFSVIALLLEVQHGAIDTRKHYVLWGLGVMLAILGVLTIFFTAFSCLPYAKIYDPLIAGHCNLKTDTLHLAYLQTGFGATMDVILGFWPVTIVYHLKIPRHVKLGFCCLMSVGILPAAASCYRVYLLKDLYTTSDSTYATGRFELWATIEVGMILIMGSIPPLRMFFVGLVQNVSSRAPSHFTSRPPTSYHNTPIPTPRRGRSRVPSMGDLFDDEEPLQEKRVTAFTEVIVLQDSPLQQGEEIV